MSKQPLSRRILTRKPRPTPIGLLLEFNKPKHRTTAAAPVTEQIVTESTPELESAQSTEQMAEQPSTEPSTENPPTEPAQSSETAIAEDAVETRESEQTTFEETTEIPETLTTTSFITTTGTPESSKLKKRRHKKTKKEAFSEYVYGRKEDDILRIEASMIEDEIPEYRLNRTYDMRRVCNNKRIDFSRMVAADVEEEKTRQNIGRVPSHLFRNPKIEVKQTLGSKFRYLYNRRPPGVKVYFKNAKMDPKQRPPFVSATNKCFDKF